jgi:glucose-6-phosphate 1-dehydrogenase
MMATVEDTTQERFLGRSAMMGRSCGAVNFGRNDYMHHNLVITILGASGDLAKKKTFPTLLDMFEHDLLPPQVHIVGYARTVMEKAAFVAMLRPYLEKQAEDPALIERFLEKVNYVSGSYNKEESFVALNEALTTLEGEYEDCAAVNNRLFYFALPPSVFIDAAANIKNAAKSPSGFNRLVVEKPFGHDLASALRMSSQLTALWSEDDIYRIDHYLGKEMVQNLLIFRFGNTFLEPLLNNHHVAAVRITFKENFGTQGRGGYFDNYGIIRDIMQNHLMQVLTLVAMEPPVRAAGDGSPNFIRDAKVNVLKAISPLTVNDIVIGQYVSDGQGNEGYLDDPSVPKDSITPTFALAVFKVNTPRWAGVPFIMKAGKALESRMAEVRIQFRDPPAAQFMFDGVNPHRNELVMRLQPDEALYMKVNVKQPGLSTNLLQSEMDLTYSKRCVRIRDSRDDAFVSGYYRGVSVHY